MKLFLYLISVIVIIALMGLFVIKKPDGQAWLSLDDLSFNTHEIENTVKSLTSKLSVVHDNYTKEDDSQLKIYRWKDSKGNWSYSDNPESEMQSEEVFLDPKAIIVLPSLELSTNDLPNSIKKHDTVSSSTESNAPSKVLSIYKGANNVQKIMDERQQTISKAIKDSGG